MEKESNISLGEAIILLAIHSQNIFVRKKIILSRSFSTVSRFIKYTPLYKKGIKKTQNKPMETTRIGLPEWSEPLYDWDFIIGVAY